MVVTQTKKRLKLKTGVIKFLIFVVIAICVVSFGIKKYKEYLYHQTDEYKLLQVGYSKSEVKDIQEKLTEKQIKNYIDQEKVDYLDDLIKEKYFMNKNLDRYLEYRRQNKKTSMQDIVAIVNVGADKDWYKNTKYTDTSKDVLMLVNKFNLLTKDYNATDIETFPLKYAYGEVSARKEAYDAFIKMADAAANDGITLILTSGFRTYDHQEEVYEEMRNANGKNYADSFAARAGASEHETGLSLDVFTYGATTETFESTDTYKWLEEHAQDYGFIRRYPAGKKYLTGYEPESWHYRYLGVETAQKVKKLGITYDEYYAYYLDK